jgi:hypothetical protein
MLGEMPERTFARLVVAGLPRTGDGAAARFPWPDLWHWYIKREREKAKDEARPKDRNEAEERLASAKAQLAEIELEDKRGNTCTRDEAAAAMGAVYERIRAQALALGPKWGPRCVGLKTTPEAVARLEEAARELLHELQVAE